jgi:alpha-tubulin suppressor-like RCC1 family protein
MPLQFSAKISESIKFRQVSCGAYHTIAVSEQGDVYACGL